MFKAVLVAAFLMAMPAFAAEVPKNQQMIRYDVYAGGIHALQANLDVNLVTKGRYNVALSAKTYGLLGKLVPWQGVFETKGWKLAKKNQPELHQSTAIWREEEEIKKYSYNKDGSFKAYSIKDDKYDGSPQDVDKVLTEGTSDVLTATLSTMEAIANGQKCEGTSEIFDGQRRYTLVFQPKEEGVLEASRYNVYAGPAVQCTVMVVPGAGKWHEKPRGWMSIQEQGRERGTMPTVWFAQIEKGQPAVPVKVRVKTEYGTLFMHMTEYQGHDKNIVLKE